MNKHVSPRMNRRAFVIGTAAVGAGLAIGLDIPFGGPAVVRAADGSPEIDAWVVVRPDDTVVIRIARSEMGQGSLTGLAQLVAEELECDWSKVSTEYPTPGQSVARKRVWGDFSTGGSRGIRSSQDYVRKGGATARVMLIQAAAEAWKVPASECTVANSVITHAPSGKTTTYGKVAEAAAKLTPPADVKLKDPKDWKLDRQGREAARHRRQDHRHHDLRHRRQAAGHAERRDQGLPGVRRQAEELRRSQDHRHDGRQEGRQGRRHRGRGRRRHLVARQDGARGAADRLGRRRQRQGLERVDREMLTEGLANEQPAYVGNKNGDAKAAIAGAAKKVEAVYSYPYQNHATMEPMNATALYTADKCEVWCGTQNGEAALRGRAGGVGPAGGEVRRLQADARRRLRPARPRPTMSARRC